MQLPVFYVAFAYCLYLWKSEGRSWQVALTWIIATAAFMTHFSAVLLYAALVLMWLLLRMPGAQARLGRRPACFGGHARSLHEHSGAQRFRRSARIFQSAQPHQPGSAGGIRPSEAGGAGRRRASATGQPRTDPDTGDAASRAVAIRPRTALAGEHSPAAGREPALGLPRRPGEFAQHAAVALPSQSSAARAAGSQLLVRHRSCAAALRARLAGRLPHRPSG